MKRLVPTGEMTLGPFFPREFGQGANDLAGEKPAGEVIEITGRVVQSDGAPIDNCILEIWQTSAAGRFDDSAFFGWGRAATDSKGIYRFRTIRPGAYGTRAPHVNFLIVYSGVMRQLQTVMFFDRSDDPVLNAVSAPVRGRLIAQKQGPNRYVFDIRLRGEGETPFFDD
jgi:protocatechuate 3,4-dioxygenase alpha subunit